MSGGLGGMKVAFKSVRVLSKMVKIESFLVQKCSCMAGIFWGDFFQGLGIVWEF